MGKKKSLSEVQRAQIVALHGQNLSERLISAQMGCSKTAVHQAIAKYQEDAPIPTGKGVEDCESALHEKTI